MDTLRDEALMGLFCDDKPEAFRILFERHKDRIFRFIHTVYMKDRSSAEDCTQEVFLKVIRHRDSFNREMSFTAWLYTVARNHCLNQIRVSQPLAMSRSELKESEQNTPDANASETLESKELGQEILSAVHTLPEQAKAVFILREIEGLSYAEIAEIMDLHQGNLRMQLHRAKRYLKEAILPYLEEHDECG